LRFIEFQLIYCSFLFAIGQMWITDLLSACFFKLLIILDAVIFHAYVCIDNGRKLVTFLIRGTKTWVIMALRLLLFTLLLAPGWYKLLRYWFFSPLIIRNLRYGKGSKNRNLLDVYLPVPQKRPKGKGSHRENNYNNSISQKSGAPVVIFVSGGAWTIGYKMWSALVARGLARLGILTIVPDYRNFPQGDIEDMMEDIRLAVEWTSQNAYRFGGDANKIVLSGQSAGAHITLCLLVSDYLRAQEEKRKRPARGTADDFLDEMGDSDSELDDDDSGSEYSDDDAATALSAPAATGGLTLDDPALIDVKLGVEASHWVPTPPSTMGNTAEYYTPLRDNARTPKHPFTPPASETLPLLTRSRSRSSGTSSRPVSWRTAKTAPGKLGVEEDDMLNSSGGALTGSAARKTPRSSTTRRRRSSSLSYAEDWGMQRRREPSSASILDLFDTMLDANISASRDGENTGWEFIGNAASTIKRGFRENLRRHSVIGGTEFDVPGAESSETESNNDAVVPERVASGVDLISPLTREFPLPAAPVTPPSPQTPVTPPVPHTPEGPDDASLWRDVPSVQKPGDVAGTDAEHLGVFSPPPAASAVHRNADPLSPAGVRGESLLRTSLTNRPPPPVAGRSTSPRHRALSNLLRGATRRGKYARRKRRFDVAKHVKLFIGVSGPYNLSELVSHIHKRGLDISILNNICRGDIAAYSPTTQLADYAAVRNRVPNLQRAESHESGDITGTTEESAQSPFTAYHPSSALQDFTPVALFHGSRDVTIPLSICTELADVLQAHGANVLCKVYEGWSHTDAILEAPLSGTMRLFHDMAGVIFAHTADCSSIAGSTNTLSAVSSLDHLVLPEPTDPADNDNYSSTPLDYISLHLFPRLFGSTVAGRNPPAKEFESRDAAPSATTSDWCDSDASGAHGSKPVVSRIHPAPGVSKTTVSSTVKQRDGHKKVHTASSTTGSAKTTGAPMVSQLLVKIAREVNPF
jgi:acetyl esterase/lipase